MLQQRFFKDSRLPFVECRSTKESKDSFKPHLHRAFCIGAVEEGEIIFNIDGDEVLLKPGTLTLINPETLHSCNPRSTEVRSFSMLYLSLDWCLSIQQSLWQNSEFIPADCNTVKDRTLYQLYVETLESLFDDAHLLEKEQKIVFFIETVFARCCYPTVPVMNRGQGLREFKQWLSINLEMDQTLESYASRKKINPYTLLRHFRSNYGVTPYAYRLNCRIEHARKLLQQGIEIGDVAQMSGFFDQSHFHRHFKAMTSTTPKQYQQNFSAGGKKTKRGI